MVKVLIVDDEKILRQGFIHMGDWTAHGYRIVGDVSNGVEALKIIEEEMPDIVVTDIRMPLMDGVELTRKIKERYPSTEVVILSSYNDYDYVRETLKLGAFDYILKPRIEFMDMLETFDKIKIKHNINNLSHQNTSFTQQVSKQYRPNNIVPVLFRIYPIRDEVSERINPDFLNIVKDMLCNFNAGIYQAEYQNVVAILNCEPDAMKILDSSLQSIVADQRIRQEYNLFVIVGNRFDGLDNIEAAAKELLNISDYSFYKDSNSVYMLDDFTLRSTSIEIDYKTLDNFIEKMDFDSLDNYLQNQIFDLIFNNLYVEPRILKNMFGEVYYYTLHKLTELGIDTKQINSQKFACFNQLENSQTLKDLMLNFCSIMAKTRNAIRDSLVKKINPMISNVMMYIAENYAQDISLTSASSHIHINKSYLSDLFKQQTGKNFVDYLTMVRINKAKELLRQPNKNIYNIGFSVGYFNSSYFSKVFKNEVGMSPLEYSKIFK